MKIFAAALREKAKCAWKNIKKYPWKLLSLRENFGKKPYVKMRILYVKKNKKLHAWKLKSAREKSYKNHWVYLFLEPFLYFVSIFFGIERFLYFWSKILCVKLKTFAWKNPFLCAWKFKANTWNFVKKSTWKNLSVREISVKTLREKRLLYVKKMKKRPKNRFTHTFFSRTKKTLGI